MRQQRTGVFETNSSSVHTVTFSREDIMPCNMKLDTDGKIHVRYGTFGTEDAIYDDQMDKLSYLITLCWYISWDDPTKCSDYDLIEEAVIDYVPNCTGIVIDGGEPDIDHQSQPYGCIEIINTWDKREVQNFIFNPKVQLKTGCD